jgi:hypothetical protein
MTWANPEKNILSERNQIQKATYYITSCQEEPNTQTKRPVVANCWDWKRWRITASGYRVSFEVTKMWN